MRAAAAVSVLAPVAALLILVFGGGTSYSCLGGTACVPPSIPDPVPIIGKAAALSAGLVICAIAWLLATVALTAHVVRVDAPRLLRAGVALALVTFGAATFGFATGAQRGLRQGAEDAALYGIGGLLVAFVVGVAWAGITARPKVDAPAMTTGGGPP